MSKSTMIVERDARDNVYLNITINQDPSQGNTPSVATYNENLTIPVLPDCSKYYVSIIRFSIPLDQVPITIFPLLVTQPNPNLSSMIIGINYLGVNYPVNVIYNNHNLNLTPPIPGVGPIFFTAGQASGPYYFIFYISQLIDMFNDALNTAFILAGSPGGVLPFYSYDPISQLISLNVSLPFRTAGANIYNNAEANNYLDSFDYFSFGYNQPFGRDFQHDLTHLNLVGTGNLPFPEDTISIELWFSLRKLLITSNNIPIFPEFSPAQNPNTGLQTGVNSSIPIISDYIPQLEFSNQTRSIAYYIPTSQYRLVDLLSVTPLSKINLNIFWQDKLGNINPLYISVNQQATIKLAFIRKDLYKPRTALLEK